jgi:serine/threonine protein kinase
LTTAVPLPYAPGDELAPGYRILQTVSSSDTFVVHEVWSEERHCRCAAKVLAPQRLEHERTRARLLREGALLLGFAHPHLVRAYEVREEPQPLLILEALPGMTLEYWLSEAERLETGDLVHLAEHLCSAVSYLHHHELLHLDLKPGNLLCSYGVVRLIDLSLARPPGPGRRGAGTHVYLAPEQALGNGLSPATDVWGIGVVLWESAAGRRPFSRPADPEAYEQLERRADPVGSFVNLPRELESLIDACLEPAPGDRPSITDIWAVIEPMLD